MKKITLSIVVLGIIGVIIIYFVNKLSNQNGRATLVTEGPTVSTSLRDTAEKTEIKAAFLIFTNGTKRDFSALMYHNLSRDAYLTSENPNIVTIAKDGITWQDFFETLPMEVRKDCLITGTKQTFCSGENGVLKFYLNGAKDDDMLVRKINNKDKALISFGPVDDPNIEYQLSQIPDLSD